MPMQRAKVHGKYRTVDINESLKLFFFFLIMQEKIPMFEKTIFENWRLRLPCSLCQGLLLNSPRSGKRNWQKREKKKRKKP